MLTNVSAEEVTAQHFSHFQLTKEGLINIFRIQSTKKQNKLHAW